MLLKNFTKSKYHSKYSKLQSEILKCHIHLLFFFKLHCYKVLILKLFFFFTLTHSATTENIRTANTLFDTSQCDDTGSHLLIITVTNVL